MPAGNACCGTNRMAPARSAAPSSAAGSAAPVTWHLPAPAGIGSLRWTVRVANADGRAAAERAVDEGLLRGEELRAGRCVLTDRGRLLADGLVARLLA